MSVEIRRLGRDDAALLDRVADGVFDQAVEQRLAAEFLADRRHHLFVAAEDGVVIGMCTAVDYVHPDKRAQLWINELGVAPSHRRRGIATLLLEAMLAHGRALGCTEAWLGTERDNLAARRVYESARGEAEAFVMYTWRL